MPPPWLRWDIHCDSAFFCAFRQPTPSRSRFRSSPKRFFLILKLCLGTHFLETPVSCLGAAHETEFREHSFPNRVWERGNEGKGPDCARVGSPVASQACVKGQP